MQRASGSVVAAVLAVIGGVQWAGAALLTAPGTPQATLTHIKRGRPALPPFSYTMFCVRYEAECRPRRFFRGGPVRLTKERWAELKAINRAVNRAIAPHPKELGLAGEQWIVNPDRGDCNDYAVSKRHELLQRGWPARALLLSEVVTSSGDHHLLLVVRARTGDLVLDNLASEIKSWSQVPYGWVRMQMPSDSRLWATIGRPRT